MSLAGPRRVLQMRMVLGRTRASGGTLVTKGTSPERREWPVAADVIWLPLRNPILHAGRDWWFSLPSDATSNWAGEWPVADLITLFDPISALT